MWAVFSEHTGDNGCQYNRHDMTEVVLKRALNINTPELTLFLTCERIIDAMS